MSGLWVDGGVSVVLGAVLARAGEGVAVSYIHLTLSTIVLFTSLVCPVAFIHK